MSRKALGAIVLGVLALAGCDSKPVPSTAVAVTPDPQPPGPPTPPTPPADPPAPKKDKDPTPPPKAEPPKVVWELDPARHAIPDATVRGTIAGAEATPEVLFENGDLVFRVPKAGATPPFDRQVVVKFTLDVTPGQPAPDLLGRKWKVAPGAPGAAPGGPAVWLDVPPKPPHQFHGDYAMTLELGPRKDDKVAGKVYLSLTDPGQTVLAGTFVLHYPRPHTERPGPDDAPYVAGDLAVTGGGAKTKVRVGYAGFLPNNEILTKDLGPLDYTLLPDGQGEWTQQPDKPRVSTHVAGDGKTRPGRYEHTKLPPGRYLLVIAVENGPTVGKWVELPAGGALTENFAVDATKTGKVEVTVPGGVTGKAVAVPADDPARTPLPGDLFTVAGVVFRADADVIAGKATITGLAPGKYEVRVGPHRGTVEVTAGKTADLTLK